MEVVDVVDQIYKLRRNFLLIGLTGRTGSGCTSVADILTTEDVSKLRSEHSDFSDLTIDNNARKNRIVHNFIQKNWHPFTVISASNIIFYYALLLSYDEFVDAITNPAAQSSDTSKVSKDESLVNHVKERLKEIKDLFEKFHTTAVECNKYLDDKGYYKSVAEIESYKKLISVEITEFRNELSRVLADTYLKSLSYVLQLWGNNIRNYNTVIYTDGAPVFHNAPSCLAHKINQFVKMFRQLDKHLSEKRKDEGKPNIPTRIVIDALRNPYEVLYFRERYSAFYLMSVNTTEAVREKNLTNANLRKEEIKEIDKKEEGKKDFTISYQEIDIDRCIELSDIFLTHDGTPQDKNHHLVNQIFTYVTLILHPGLVPPSSLERAMQVAYTAKLNSGCLSRQVGAAVTNSSYSVVSIGWNTSAEGQTPCTLRNLCDLCKQEDPNAYSDFEKDDEDFSDYVNRLKSAYDKREAEYQVDLKGLAIPYCFKDIYTTYKEKERGNQVHTRSLHAEENAFLQLAKYGSMGIKDGILFTTASCCELCAKKAYQLGIRKIYYIDSYPGISHRHILGSGPSSMRPEMILFHGAVGRAYINLYNPFVPLKDELKARTGVDPKDLDGKEKKLQQNLKDKNGNHTNDTESSSAK